MAPGWNRSRFVVANAGVNDDALTGCVNNEGMNAHNELSFRCRKMRHQPFHILDGRGRCLRQNETGAPGDFHFDNSSDRHVAYLPDIHRWLLLPI